MQHTAKASSAQSGGTRRTIEYALRRRLDVVILPPVEA